MTDQGFIGVEDGWSGTTVIVVPSFLREGHGERGVIYVYLGGRMLGKIEPRKPSKARPWARSEAFTWDTERGDYFSLGLFMSKIDCAMEIIQDLHNLKDERVRGQYYLPPVREDT